MQITSRVTDKNNDLPEDKQQSVFSVVEQSIMTSLDAVEKLRAQGLKNPMEMDEINSFVEEARGQKC